MSKSGMERWIEEQQCGIFAMQVLSCDDVELLRRELANRKEGSLAHKIVRSRLDELGQ